MPAAHPESFGLSLTEGVLVRICRLIETAATEAIRSGQEQISLAQLKDDLVLATKAGSAPRGCVRRRSGFVQVGKCTAIA
jgi:hypothetical protein